MANHSSATTREETPHVSQTTTHTSKAVRRRAESVVNDHTIDAQSRALIRFALEMNDPWLADIVRRAGAGEKIIDSVDFTLEPEANEDDSNKERVEALAEIICRAGDESAAALLVLMGTLENSTDPKLLANTAKHFAFTRCGELNSYGMVDAQIATLEGELLTAHTFAT